MSRNADIYSFKSFTGLLHPNSVAKIGPFPFQCAVQIKGIGATIAIGGFDTPATFGTTLGMTIGVGGGSFVIGQTFAPNYVMPPNEVFSGNVSGYIYVYSAAATLSYNVLAGLTKGE